MSQDKVDMSAQSEFDDTNGLLTMMKEPQNDDEEVEEQYEEDEEVKLFEGFSFALSYHVTEEDLLWKVDDLRKKIVSNHGQLYDQINEKVNIILVLSTMLVDTTRISHAMKFTIPIVTEQYVHDCVSCNTRLDWNQYQVVTSMNSALLQQPSLAAHGAAAALQQHYSALVAQTAAAASHPNAVIPKLTTPPNAKSNFSLKMYLKGSRQSVFTEQFPEVLYTLTWNHKYDIQIKASENIFEGLSQSKILDSIEVALVLSQTNEIPVYDEDDKTRKKKRMKGEDDAVNTLKQAYSQYSLTMSPLQQQQMGLLPGMLGAVGGGSFSARGRGKKRAGSRDSNETVCVSGLSKGGDDEIVIRFGVKSTFCSKRFNYGAFKLYINYAPPDVSNDFHFTIYSSEFKTFVKKNANIAKYLHSPQPLNGSITVVTKAMTHKYSKYMTFDTPEVSTATQEKAVVGKKRTRKGKKKDDEPDPRTTDHTNQVALQQQMAMNPMMGSAMGMGGFEFGLGVQFGMMGNPMGNPMGKPMMNPMMGMHPYGVVDPVAHEQVNGTDKGLQWYGDPVGINVNGDVFYYAFAHGEAIYKVNDFVFLVPDTDKEDEAPKSDESGEWDKYWICKIINLVHNKVDGMKMMGQWFYRSSDLPETVIPKLPNELFVSFDFNYNALNSIRGKCSVRHCTQPESQENLEYIAQSPHKNFFFRSGFNRLRAEIFELGEGVLRVLREKSNDGELHEEVEEDEETPMDEHEHMVNHHMQQHFAFDPQYQIAPK